MKEGALGYVRWHAHSGGTPTPNGAGAALEAPIVRPREQFGEVGVISPLRIKDEASRMKKERQGC
jgi:hypothetical protein